MRTLDVPLDLSANERPGPQTRQRDLRRPAAGTGGNLRWNRCRDNRSRMPVHNRGGTWRRQEPARPGGGDLCAVAGPARALGPLLGAWRGAGLLAMGAGLAGPHQDGRLSSAYRVVGTGRRGDRADRPRAARADWRPARTAQRFARPAGEGAVSPVRLDDRLPR